MGRYSEQISPTLAKTLVKDKKSEVFSKFVSSDMGFWFSYYDKKLHYGRGHLEGTLALNEKGKKYFENNKEKWGF